MRSRDRSSSQMDTPASASCLESFGHVVPPLSVVPVVRWSRAASAGDRADAVLGRGGDGLGGDAELAGRCGRSRREAP